MLWPTNILPHEKREARRSVLRLVLHRSLPRQINRDARIVLRRFLPGNLVVDLLKLGPAW